MFFAAFTSRSCTAPHSLQTHSLIRKPALPFGLLAAMAAAARTSLGGVALIHYLKDDTGLLALVFQHRLQLAQPASSVLLAILVLTSLRWPHRPQISHRIP
jgi:hypothetical protein